MKWQDVKGWLAEEEGAELQRICESKIVLEIGSYLGRSTLCISEVANLVVALDWHRGDEGTRAAEPEIHNTLHQFLINITDYVDKDHTRWTRWNIVPIIGTTSNAEEFLRENSFHVVFVDGAHDEKQVENDIRLALMCIKPGGTIAIHDWDRESVRKGALRAEPGLSDMGKVTGTLYSATVCRPTYSRQCCAPTPRMLEVENVLSNELASLDQQMADAKNRINQGQSDVLRVEGAQMMIRHLAAKVEKIKNKEIGNGRAEEARLSTDHR